MTPELQAREKGPDRVEVTIELPAIDVPVVGYGLTLAAVQARRRFPDPVVGDLIDYVGDALIAADLDVDPSDLDEGDLFEHVAGHAIQLSRARATGPLDMAERIQVDVDYRRVE